MNLNKKTLDELEDDDNVDLTTYTNYLKDNLERDKKRMALEFNEISESCLNEIERKKKLKNKIKKKYIPYILKHSYYTKEEIENYELDNVVEIYTELKNNNKFRKIFKFLFNI